MLFINEMIGEERRQLIDARQVFEAYEEKRRMLNLRYTGSMRWAARNGAEYLLRKRGKAEISLGRRSPETERTYLQFMGGRKRIAGDLRSLEARLVKMGPVNMAQGLGRVPRLTARILRRLHDAGLLGRHLYVVGTNALFAYEARAGVRLEGGLLATGDADLLMDARRKLRLAINDVRREGVLGIIKKVDRSFEPRGPRDFRAVNRDGFYVDLIRPQTGDVMSSKERDRIGESANDLRGSPIHGLNWLLNAPKFGTIAIDEAGFPVRIETVDPRAFALHKAWISKLPDRDPVKKGRDRHQAVAAATLAERYLGLPFESEDLSAFPLELREQAPDLLRAGVGQEPGLEDGDGVEPRWW